MSRRPFEGVSESRLPAPDENVQLSYQKQRTQRWRLPLETCTSLVEHPPHTIPSHQTRSHTTSYHVPVHKHCAPPPHETRSNALSGLHSSYTTTSPTSTHVPPQHGLPHPQPLLSVPLSPEHVPSVVSHRSSQYAYHDVVDHRIAPLSLRSCSTNCTAARHPLLHPSPTRPRRPARHPGIRGFHASCHWYFCYAVKGAVGGSFTVVVSGGLTFC